MYKVHPQWQLILILGISSRVCAMARERQDVIARGDNTITWKWVFVLARITFCARCARCWRARGKTCGTREVGRPRTVGGGVRMRGASEQTNERVAAAGSAMQPGWRDRKTGRESRGGYI